MRILKFLSILPFILIIGSSQASEVLYFGDSHSTGTNLGARILRFLQNPSANGCQSAASGENDVLKLNGNGLDPRHWLSSSSGTRRFLYRALEQRDEVSRAQEGQTPLQRLIVEQGQNPDRRLVMEFGDNSLGGNGPDTFTQNLERMIEQLGVSPENCIVVAPQPNVKPEHRAAKDRILASLREFRDQGKCNVVFYDESSGGRLPLTDGIHSTPSGYNRWADQATSGICSANILRRTEVDSISGCDECQNHSSTTPDIRNYIKSNNAKQVKTKPRN